MDSLEAQFERWQKQPPRDLVGDPIWRMTAYRIALFLADLVRQDARILFDRGAPSHKVSQLESSVESVEANISEGYSKFSGKDRAKFFETVVSATGVKWLLAGACVTVVPLLIVGVLARVVGKMNFMDLSGLLAGSMTDPPALAFASNTAGSDAPTVAYATVFPLTTLLRILSAQVLAITLCS